MNPEIRKKARKVVHNFFRTRVERNVEKYIKTGRLLAEATTQPVRQADGVKWAKGEDIALAHVMTDLGMPRDIIGETLTVQRRRREPGLDERLKKDFGVDTTDIRILRREITRKNWQPDIQTLIGSLEALCDRQDLGERDVVDIFRSWSDDVASRKPCYEIEKGIEAVLINFLRGSNEKKIAGIRKQIRFLKLLIEQQK